MRLDLQQTVLLVVGLVAVAVIRPIIDPHIFGGFKTLLAAFIAPGNMIQSYPPFAVAILLPSAP